MDDKKTSQPTKDACPGWLWQAGSADRDWPEDADHENGNYQNKCLGCGEYFIGHKRRCFCRKCSDASKARWESLTPDQQAAEQRKADAELTAWLSSQNSVVSHTGALPDSKISNQAPSPGVGL